jgi:hypothetical protein
MKRPAHPCGWWGTQGRASILYQQKRLFHPFLVFGDVLSSQPRRYAPTKQLKILSNLSNSGSIVSCGVSSPNASITSSDYWQDFILSNFPFQVKCINICVQSKRHLGNSWTSTYSPFKLLQLIWNLSVIVRKLKMSDKWRQLKSYSWK